MGQGGELQQTPSVPSRPPAPPTGLPGETKGRSGAAERSGPPRGRGSVSAGLGRRCVAVRRGELNSRVIKRSENAAEREENTARPNWRKQNAAEGTTMEEG